MSSKEPAKVVVRLLPPEITEEELLATIPEVHRQHIKWKSFSMGRRYPGEARPSLNSRCYLQFEELPLAEDFIKDYHGHQFVDGQGESFRAVVCFAPYQKVPRQKSQADPRDGTIEDDATYKQFVASLSESLKATYEPPPNPVLALKPENYSDTPLLSYMRYRVKDRLERQKRKEKRRKDWSLEQISEEEPKRPRWRCSECGTSKNLEEDPDNRGSFYCIACWEHWESQPFPDPKVKKKKKKSKDDYEEEELAEDESTSTKKKKKKKADREDEQDWRAHDNRGGWHEEEDGRGRWRVKKQEPSDSLDPESKHKSRTKASRKEDEEWWGESEERKTKKSSKISKSESGPRWRAKGAANDEVTGDEDKSRKSRKDRKGREGDAGDASGGGRWVPKS